MKSVQAIHHRHGNVRNSRSVHLHLTNDSPRKCLFIAMEVIYRLCHCQPVCLLQQINVHLREINGIVYKGCLRCLRFERAVKGACLRTFQGTRQLQLDLASQDVPFRYVRQTYVQTGLFLPSRKNGLMV